MPTVLNAITTLMGGILSVFNCARAIRVGSVVEAENYDGDVDNLTGNQLHAEATAKA